MGLRQGSGLLVCSSSSRKYPGTEGTNQNRHWDHHRLHATNSPDLVTLEGSSCTDIMTCTGGCGYNQITFYSPGSIFIGWAKHFPQNFPFKKSWFITVENSCWFPKNIKRIFFFVWQLELAEACNLKRENLLVCKAPAT